ncbi:MAG: YHS domain-containing (seleno)protein [Verrucomicrobiota bacterium]
MNALTTPAYLIFTSLIAHTSPVLHSGDDKLALLGFDPVAYFTENAALEGSSEYTSVHLGITYQFVNEKHLRLFEKNPTAYLPQYGGYCAYGVSKGGLYKIDPKSWSILDGKLYLNYDSGVQRKWAKQAEVYIERADEKWPELAAKKARRL